MATTTATAAATAATATLADLVWGFSGPAAVRLGPRWFGGFPGRRRFGRVGVGLGIFRDFSRYAVTDIGNFQWYAVTDIRAVSAGSSGFGL